jgi:hypothetical protein
LQRALLSRNALLGALLSRNALLI